jgi:phage FluMu gp28-like protein
MSLITAEMQALAAEADYKFVQRAPAVMLPYQQKWLADTASKVKICEKSRRIGLSWAEACDAVLCAALDPSEGGMDVWYIGYVKDMAIEFILDCAQWATHFQSLADAIEVSEDIFTEGEEKKSVFVFSIKFASGNRITALSSRPRNLRGKQGRVILDEAAFHEAQGEILKAAMALLIWGGSLRVISTHDGDANPFNELIKDTRAGKFPYSVHRITFDEALKDGLYQRICLRTGETYTEAGAAKWAADIRASYGEDAEEELDCVPKNGSGAWLSRALIEQCMNKALPVLRLSKPPEFTFAPQRQRVSDILEWCEEFLEPELEKIPKHLQCFLGCDIGRVSDLSAFMPLVQQQNLVRQAPFLVELRSLPFDAQQLILYFIIDRLPNFRHGAIDARGLGYQMAEQAAQKYGQTRITQVMLSEPWYIEHMPPYKAAFEDRNIEIPSDADVLADHRVAQMIKGVARIPDLRTHDAQKKKRHGDTLIAGVMAWFASRQEGGPVHVTSRAGGSSRDRTDTSGYLE